MFIRDSIMSSLRNQNRQIKKAPIIEKSSKKDMREIIFEDIDDNFSRGNYLDLEVVIMKKNGYINATKMCNFIGEKIDKNVRLRKWKDNQSSEELIVEIFSNFGDSSKNSNSSENNDRGIYDKASKFLLIRISVGKNELRGTYCHPLLISHIASWASPKFALKVSHIVNNFAINQEIEKRDLIIEEQKRKLKKKDKKIDVMHRDILAIIEMNKKLERKNKKILEINKKMNNTLNDVNNKHDAIHDKLDIVVNDRVVSTGKQKDTHMLVIWKNNIDESNYDEGDAPYPYYTRRILRQKYNKSLKDHKEKYQKSECLLVIDYTPNAINLWKRIKKKCGKNIIVDGTGNGFKLNSKYSEKRFIKDAKRVHNERLKTRNI